MNIHTTSLYGAANALVQLKIYDILNRYGTRDLTPSTAPFTNVNSGNTHTVNNYFTSVITNETTTIDRSTIINNYNERGDKDDKPGKGNKVDKKA